MDHHSVPLSEEDKAMIVAGDNKVLVKLLQTMMSKFTDNNSLASPSADEFETKNGKAIMQITRTSSRLRQNTLELKTQKSMVIIVKRAKNSSVAFETGGKESKVSLLAPVLPIIPLNSAYERKQRPLPCQRQVPSQRMVPKPL